MWREEMHKAARVEEAGAGREEAARVEEAAAPKASIAKVERKRRRRHDEAARREAPTDSAGATEAAAPAEATGAAEAAAPAEAAAGESTPDVPPQDNVDTHSGGLVNVSWVHQGASVRCAWREADGLKAKWLAATIVNLNEDGTVRVRFTSHRSFCDDVDRGDIRQVAKAEAQVGTNLLAEFEGKVAEPAAAAAEVVTAETAAATAEAATPAEAAAAGAVTGKALTAEPRVSLHVCCQSVHATGSQGPWCASCQGQVHSEEHCSQVVRRNGGNELACKSCVQFRSGNGPCYEQWP
jgi:hypothetical protein